MVNLSKTKGHESWSTMHIKIAISDFHVFSGGNEMEITLASTYLRSNSMVPDLVSGLLQTLLIEACGSLSTLMRLWITTHFQVILGKMHPLNFFLQIDCFLWDHRLLLVDQACIQWVQPLVLWIIQCMYMVLQAIVQGELGICYLLNLHLKCYKAP